jgi:trypsin
VLTAAHCVPNTTAKEVDVYVGSHLLASGTNTGASRLHVRRIISHKAFNRQTFDNDVALLQLMTPAPATLKPVTISTPQMEPGHAVDGKTLTVIGWGRLSESGPRSSKLMEVDIQVQPRTTCETNYKAVDPSVTISTNMFCAGVPAGDKDSCKGDSGGYIGAPATAGGFVQLGVVSWGFGCARPALFGVYTRLANYEAWVREVLKSF